MKINRLLVHLIFLFSFIAGCAPGKNLIVLLPDEDGRTGQIIVSNQKGNQLLSEPRQATVIKNKMTSPSPPVVMDEPELKSRFGAALDALPESPLHFQLYFHMGGTNLTEESQKLIPKILAQMSLRRITDVTIIGHADRVGSQEANFKLGFNRARTIRDLLIKYGMDGKIIEVVSCGEDNPLVLTPDEVAEPRNRRVEVILR